MWLGVGQSVHLELFNEMSIDLITSGFFNCSWVSKYQECLSEDADSFVPPWCLWHPPSPAFQGVWDHPKGKQIITWKVWNETCNRFKKSEFSPFPGPKLDIEMTK